MNCQLLIIVLGKILSHLLIWGLKPRLKMVKLRHRRRGLRCYQGAVYIEDYLIIVFGKVLLI